MPKKILIVEDDPIILKMMRKRLLACGYEVMVASDGATGLKMARTKQPDLITLDIVLPEINGFTICSLLKGNEEYRSIPIIIITGRNEEQDTCFDESVKPEAFFLKPFSPEVLLAKIHELVHHNPPE
jgi:DNA-binding response OmpR family regulator